MTVAIGIGRANELFARRAKMRPEFSTFARMSDGEVISLAREREIAIPRGRVDIEELKWKLAELASEQRLFEEELARFTRSVPSKEPVAAVVTDTSQPVIPDLELRSRAYETVPDEDLRMIAASKGVSVPAPFDRTQSILELVLFDMRSK